MAEKLEQAKKPRALENLSARYLKGVGPERFRLLERLGIKTLEDMIHFFPRRYEDRSAAVPAGELGPDRKTLVEIRVVSKRLFRTRQGRELFRLIGEDASGRCSAVWFGCPYLDHVFAAGQRVALYGRADKEGAGFQFIHPDYETLDAPDGRRVHTGRIAPVYPLTHDLNQRALRALQYELLVRHLKDIEDPIPAAVRSRQGLVNKRVAIKGIHFPSSAADLERAYRRLVFEDFFVIQSALALVKKNSRKESGAALAVRGDAREAFYRLLPFEATPGQRKAIDDVWGDLQKGAPMQRLLQGEVGSGKTTVAAFALFAAAHAGHQGALMVPTEILAQQHLLTLSRLLSPAGIAVAFLAQGMSAEERARSVAAAASGDIRVFVGTHALIQETLKFKDLRLAVIDEQHRFGVLQRKFLAEKSSAAPHVLVMTATPIPRTLAMTLYGELDITTMTDAPKGRGRVRTMWVSDAQREAVYRVVEEELARGRQAFFIHPLVRAGADNGLKDAAGALRALRAQFPSYRAELVHGQMSAAEKQKVMSAFRENRVGLLVATSIVEVGVDVPNATVLVVENAERFGLSQLHQLRGRIGRGAGDSSCFVFSNSDHPAATARLRVFADLESGFDVAEEDLRLRGPGDFLGDRQHGVPALRIGDLVKDVTLLEAARREAFAFAENDSAGPGERTALRAEVARRFPGIRANP